MQYHLIRHRRLKDGKKLFLGSVMVLFTMFPRSIFHIMERLTISCTVTQQLPVEASNELLIS